jgi:Raf kinase inhibitor-like YbhB/YbcL family protein
MTVRDFMSRIFYGLVIVLSFLSVAELFISQAQTTKPLKSNQKGEVKMDFKLESPVFSNGSMIPEKYSCDGEDISPVVEWKNVPEGTQSLALIMDDPDAPAGIWVHWVIYDIPPSNNRLPENVSKKDIKLSGTLSGALQGTNSWGNTGYGGPCPPRGVHRFFFKLYALDTLLKQENLNKKKLLDAMKNHILAQTELMGKYQR